VSCGIEIPQAREAAMPFVSKLFPKWHCKRLLRTDPLKALIIGGFVRGLSMRDVESLCEEAGLGKTSRSTVSRVCAELHERFEAFKRRSLYDVNLVVLFLDAIYLPVRPSGPKEGVICAWGITENGQRALVSVRLGMRETKEDWLELGRDLIARGLAAPRLIVADGAPGLISAVEEIWPRADRQHCAVHRLRNLHAKLPKSEHDRIRFNYWSALTDATSVKDGKLRLKVLISELEHAGYDAAARSLAEDLDALVAHLRYPLRHRERWRSTNLLERSLGEVRRRTKVMAASPARPAASPSSGPCSTCSSATPATAPPSPTSTANTSTESNTNKPTPTPSTRRPPPPKLNHGNPNRQRIYSSKETQPSPTNAPACGESQDRNARRRRVLLLRFGVTLCRGIALADRDSGDDPTLNEAPVLGRLSAARGLGVSAQRRPVRFARRRLSFAAKATDRCARGDCRRGLPRVPSLVVA
jgi:transposase-like protein